MVDIAVWRARIGLFNLSTGRLLAGKRVKVRRPGADWSGLLSSVTLTPLEAVTVLSLILLVLSGDVEMNPGPGRACNELGNMEGHLSKGRHWYPHQWDTSHPACYINIQCLVVMLTCARLVMGGDVETNPGPGRLGDVPSLSELHSLKYMGKEGVTHELSIINSVAPHWQKLGLALNFTADGIMNIEHSRQGHTVKCCEDLLSCWLQGAVGDVGAVTWGRLLGAMEDAHYKELAQQLREILSDQAHMHTDCHTNQGSISAAKADTEQPHTRLRGLTHSPPPHQSDSMQVSPTTPATIYHKTDSHWPHQFSLPPVVMEYVQHIKQSFCENTNTFHITCVNCYSLALIPTKTPLHISEVGRITGGKIPCSIQVDGAAGTGKTSFALGLCLQWANGQLLQQWPMVALFQARHRQTREAKTLFDLILHPIRRIRKEVCRYLEETHGMGMLLIIDGYDELSESQQANSPVLKCLLQRTLLPQSTLLITSRPNVTVYHGPIDQHIELLGNTDHIDQFLRYWFSDDHEIVEFKMHLRSHPFLSDIIYNPQHFDIVLELFPWTHVPRTLTELHYAYAVMYLGVDKYTTLDKPTALSDLPPEVNKQLMLLAKLAAQGIEQHQHIFDELPPNIRTQGLMSHWGSISSKRPDILAASHNSWSFHSLVHQEFFAALYFSQLPFRELEKLHKNGVIPLVTNDVSKLFESSEHARSLLLGSPNHQQLDRALQEGKVEVEISLLTIHGAPGTGKSSLLDLLLEKEPKSTRNSTLLTSCPARDVTGNRIAVSENGSKWVSVKVEEMMNWIAENIKSMYSMKQDTVENADFAPVTPQQAMDIQGAGGDEETNLSENNGSKMVWTTTTQQVGSRQQESSLTKRPLETTSVTGKELIELLLKATESNRLLKAHWIYTIDSGGQPQFQNLLPLFIRNNSMNIVTLPLNQSLHDKPKLEFVLQNQHICQPTDLLLSNKELVESLFRSLSSVQQQPIRRATVKSTPSSPHFMVVGTFADEVDANEIARKNEQLTDVLKPFQTDHIFCKPFKKEVICPVNTMAKKEREKIASDLHFKINSSGSSLVIDVPLRWFVLEIMLVRMAKEENRYILTLDECSKVARDINIDEEEEVKAALIYISKFALFLYFPDDFPHLVFTNPQPLMNRLSHIVVLSFAEKAEVIAKIIKCPLPWGVHEQLQKGLLTRALLSCLPDEGLVPGIFEEEDFLKLIKSLLIVSPVKVGKVVKYFCPCILPQQDRVETKLANTYVDPLVLLWPKPPPFSDCLQPLPLGLFPALVSHLLSYTDTTATPMFGLPHDTPQYRNAIQLACYLPELAGSVLLVDSVYFIEIHFSGARAECPAVRDAVEKAISVAETKLHYVELSTTLQHAFLCSICTDSSSSLPTHPCLIRHRHGQYWVTCLINKCAQPLSDERKLSWLAGNQATSETQASGLMAAPCGVLGKRDGTPTILDLYNMEGTDGKPLKVIERICARYKVFGMNLLQDSNGDTVEVIRKDHISEGVEAITEAILRRWLASTSEGPTCTYSYLIDCLRKTGLGALADDLKKSLKDCLN